MVDPALRSIKLTFLTALIIFGGGHLHGASTGHGPVGTNLVFLDDWSTEIPFIDAFKTSRPWISGNSKTGVWDDKRPIETDSSGWPTHLLPNQIARTLMFWDISKYPVASYPAGRYTVFHKGHGRIEYGNAAQIDESAIPSPTRDIIEVNPKRGGILLMITKTDPRDPLRDIHVIPPGGQCSLNPNQYCLNDSQPQCGRCIPFTKNYATQIFHPNFLKSIRHYNTLRFKDWMVTDNSTQTDWAHRPKPTDARWIQGAPVEIMVQLANRLNVNPWFNMPHQADDHYIEEFAKYVRGHLNPSLKTYVEYSNEVWNGSYPQWQYAQEHGQKLNLSRGNRHAWLASDCLRLVQTHKIPFSTLIKNRLEKIVSRNNYQAGLAYHSFRSVQIFRIWASTLPQDRLVRVMGSFTGPQVTEQVLTFHNAYLDTDALAIAPYFSMPETWRSDQAATTSVDQAIDELRDKSFPQLFKTIKEQAEIIHRIDPRISLVAYEGGQGLVGVGPDTDNPHLNSLFDSVNRSPRMKGLYLFYLNGWKNNDGKLFVHYTDCGVYSRWGRWGSMEYIGQNPKETPKFNALQEFSQTNSAK